MGWEMGHRTTNAPRWLMHTLALNAWALGIRPNGEIHSRRSTLGSRDRGVVMKMGGDARHRRYAG